MWHNSLQNSILVVFYFDSLPFWSSSILCILHFGRLPSWSSSILVQKNLHHNLIPRPALMYSQFTAMLVKSVLVFHFGFHPFLSEIILNHTLIPRPALIYSQFTEMLCMFALWHQLYRGNISANHKQAVRISTNRKRVSIKQSSKLTKRLYGTSLMK